MPSPALGDLNGERGSRGRRVERRRLRSARYNGNGSREVGDASCALHPATTRRAGGVADRRRLQRRRSATTSAPATTTASSSLNGANGAIMTRVDKFESHDSGRPRSATSVRASAGGSSSPASTRRTTRAACRRSRCPRRARRRRGRCSAATALHQRGSGRAAPAAGRAVPRPRRTRRRIPSRASSQGYWVAGADGGVYALKGAPFYGSAVGRIRGTAVAIAATHSGNGYYVLDNSGGIFPFGDAHVVRVDGGPAPQRADHRARADADRAAATGCWRATAACSASATRASTVRWAASA